MLCRSIRNAYNGHHKCTPIKSWHPFAEELVNCVYSMLRFYPLAGLFMILVEARGGEL